MSTGMIGCRGGGIPEEPEKILQKVRKLERFYRVREGTFGWCGRRDSNPHSCRGSDFKLATQGLTQHHGASSNELGTSENLAYCPHSASPGPLAHHRQTRDRFRAGGDMAANWVTVAPGIRAREHPTRKHGVR